jgi:hypothetical protein
MANRRLTDKQLAVANKLLALVRSKLKLLRGVGRQLGFVPFATLPRSTTLAHSLRAAASNALTQQAGGKPAHPCRQGGMSFPAHRDPPEAATGSFTSNDRHDASQRKGNRSNAD